MIDPTDMELIRRYGDGELTPGDAASFERRLAHEPALAAAVAFERGLRTRVAAAMAVSAPPELARQVTAALEREPAAPPAGAPGGAQRSHRRHRMGLRHAGPRHPRRINVFAVAACLMLVAAAVLYGIFGQPIDRIRPSGSSNLIVDAAAFVFSEHGRCARSEAARLSKAQARMPEEARELLTIHLGMPVQVYDLTGMGYRFVGGGRCRVPGATRSGHLIYRSDASLDRPAYISIFIEPDQGQFAHCGQQFPDAGGAREGRLWSDGGLVYLMVACRCPDLTPASALVKQESGRCGR